MPGGQREGERGAAVVGQGRRGEDERGGSRAALEAEEGVAAAAAGAEAAEAAVVAA